MDTALMREEMTLNTSSPPPPPPPPPPTGEEVKNKHVREVEEWIGTTVKETLFEYIKS
jgi:hypothetical protein